MSPSSQHPFPLILASASPSRRRLLEQAHIPCQVKVSGFDEDRLPGSMEPGRLVTALAQGKAGTVLERLPHPGPLVLGCDSVLVFRGAIQGKPTSADEAIQRWRVLAGREGALYTGHCLLDSGLERSCHGEVVTRVRFASVDDATIEHYVATGEPLGCAGAFALEGRGGLLIDAIEGCASNVMGLSLPWLRHRLVEWGFSLAALWSMEANGKKAP
ncbi:MAG: septum formation inhibitor Maf [Synechococcus sp. SB0673_bin_10]|nr:septum formation inhibitor Maf [Synechococcus sp. SB0667_bin_8]MYF19201.1 septum formation inhibitor Maf [Synechococcus sp. SB0677_bin_5]MYG64340.1 septum formation inhibitor Maf [Synechococcus sp. SB0675_bin_7]MYI72666.1 septum formation inhibitor Maf [Synechococcus sp. SB0673_bin_10]MYK85833.1 septum formation inhibitor Maf [Synechococcus sp. SB0669_bin_7]